ncbi:MAG: hypothetical protein U0521_01525 [Anaerolineae bacterium]
MTDHNRIEDGARLVPGASLLNGRRVRQLTLLVVLLASLYLITYTARIESGDTRRFFDAVSSLVDYGDFYLDQSASRFLAQTFDDSLYYPLQRADVEPLQVIAAAPLYLMARVVPGIGLAHAVYLFNVLVGAAAAGVLFVYALALGYSERASLLAAVAFGVGTAIFPYTKTFFREPLVLLMLLICGLLIERLRAGGYRSIPLMIAVGVALVGLLLAKASALLALPALVVIAIPSSQDARVRWVALILGLLMLVVVGIFAVLSAVSAFGDRYNLLKLLRDDSASYLLTALQAYLLSIGGSIWGTSPVVLLALPGMWMLLRRREARYPLAILLLVGAFAVGYAGLNGAHWFGGLSLSPRFLIPVLPFLMIGALPVFERIGRQPLWTVIGAALLVYGIWVQLSGVTLDWSAYPAALPPEANGLIEWGGGLNDPRYLRWVIVPQLWATTPLDIAWTVVNAPGMMLAFAALALAAGTWLVRSLKRRISRRVFILPALLIVLIGVGLRLLYADDPRYLSGDDALYAMLPIIEAETDPGDVVLLSSPRYESFFDNSGKLSGAGRVITLPFQPGEQPSPEQEPQIRSDNPMALLTKDTIQLIYNLAATRARLWLLVNGGPDLPWDVRPVERFMDAHYYPIRVLETSPQARLIEYSTISAPDRFAYRDPEHLTDLAFGGHIRLVGFDLPGGTYYTSGGVLAVSTYWKTDAPLDPNYSIGLYLRDASGAPVAQVDGEPDGAFAPTSGWQVGVPVWDNRAIRLPADLAPGTYQLWIKPTIFAPDGSARDLPVTAGEHIDDSVGVLVTLQVG